MTSADASSLQTATRRVATSGSLEHFSLCDVLQSLGQSTAHFHIEILGIHHEQIGTIAIRAGMVVSAAVGSTRGARALRRLCAMEKGSFCIKRLPSDAQSTQALGAISQMLLAAMAPEDSPPPQSEPGATPRTDEVTRSVRPPSSPGTEARDQDKEPQQTGISIAIASAKGGVGKTTIAVNLAHALAVHLGDTGARILLIDGTLNGDVLSALNSQYRQRVGGLLEVFHGHGLVEHMVLPTLRPNLHLLPAFGLSMRVAERAEDPGTERWRELLERLRAQADLILIDTGAGLYGHTASILAAATYVLGVVQAEPLSARLADRFQHVLPGLAGGGASLLGLVVNMVAPDSTTSVEALEAVAARHQGELFATGIPRTGSIPSASRAGGPALADDPALAGIFEDLAAEICARLEQRMASTTTSLKPPTGERT